MSSGHPPNVSNPYMVNDAPPYSDKKNRPTNLVQLAKTIVNLPSSKPSIPEFKFSLDQESTQKNLRVLRKYDFNLTAALKAKKDSLLIHGSEFKTTKVLDPIFSLHPNWSRIKSILEIGSN